MDEDEELEKLVEQVKQVPEDVVLVTVEDKVTGVTLVEQE